MGLPYNEEIMIIGPTTWAQSTSVTDRQIYDDYAMHSVTQ